MREAEKREIEDLTKVEEFLRNARMAVDAKEEVEHFEEGDYEILRIKKGDRSITRKKHTVPEYMDKDGDWLVSQTRI